MVSGGWVDRETGEVKIDLEGADLSAIVLALIDAGRKVERKENATKGS